MKKSKELVVKFAGVPANSAERIIIMLHGRGADAEDILTVSKEIWITDTCYLAPQAEGNTWYPYSFMSPIEQNEPSLSEALTNLGYILKELKEADIPDEKIYWFGFSQGACLALEFTARNATKYGGVFALSGGLIGNTIDKSHYKKQFKGTPIFLGCSDTDPHIPVDRIHETAEVLKELGAEVRKEIYPGMGHVINKEELAIINETLLQKWNH